MESNGIGIRDSILWPLVAKWTGFISVRFLQIPYLMDSYSNSILSFFVFLGVKTKALGEDWSQIFHWNDEASNVAWICHVYVWKFVHCIR